MYNPNWDGNPLTEYTYILVPCGKCLACRINRRREWTVRLLNEEIYSSSSFFVTLTYDNEHLPLDKNGNPCVCKRDVQLWLKRLRKKFGSGIRYFLNSEYGELGRPHYHAIIFNLPPTFAPDSHSIIRFSDGHKSISFHSHSFQQIWGKGDVEYSEATKERCGYCAKYFVDRKEIDSSLVPNFSLISKGTKFNKLGGIGSRYAEAIKSKVRYNQSVSMIHPSSGKYVAIPRLYRNKIYSEEERQKMFQQYFNDYSLSDEYISLLENHKIVEANQLKAMTFKRKKSKI